jgi:hypothetical protein
MAMIYFHPFDIKVEMYSAKRMNLVHFSIFVQNEGSIIRSIFLMSKCTPIDMKF